MQLVVIADDMLKEEFLLKPVPADVQTVFIATPQQVPANAGVIFDLLFENTFQRIDLLKSLLPVPVFVNAVTDTLAMIGEPFIRINGWPTFLKREILETVAAPAQHEQLQQICSRLQWQYRLVPDQTGMISARVVAAIINEAYFTVAGNTSSRAETDIAMKLGTHYPWGPFEWSQKIGLSRIHGLLVQLNKENRLYTIADLLTHDTFA